MRKIGQDDWSRGFSGKQTRWRTAMFGGGRLECGPRVPRCDVRELRRKRFSRGKMRHLLGDPVRMKGRWMFGSDRAYNWTGCRRMVVPF